MSQDKNHHAASDLPGAVSDQNGEEAQSGHRQDGTHPEQRISGQESKGHEPKKHDEHDSKAAPTGAAGEGSQSTGHRQNAG